MLKRISASNFGHLSIVLLISLLEAIVILNTSIIWLSYSLLLISATCLNINNLGYIPSLNFYI